MAGAEVNFAACVIGLLHDLIHFCTFKETYIPVYPWQSKTDFGPKEILWRKWYCYIYIYICNTEFCPYLFNLYLFEGFIVVKKLLDDSLLDACKLALDIPLILLSYL